MENAGRTKLLPLGQVTLREEPIFLTPPYRLDPKCDTLKNRITSYKLYLQKTVPIVSINKYGVP